MSTYLYDEALVENLRTLTKDTRIHIVPPDNLFRLIGRIEEDEIEMPLISLVRTGWQLANSRPHTAKFDGALSGYDESSKKLERLQALPINISYQLDVWTKTRLENDNILRELIFYYSTHPTLLVRIGYGLDITHNFNIFIDNDIEDNSDIVEHRNRGEYFRQTISLYTDDAYLWKSSSRYPTFVHDSDIDVINEIDGGELSGKDL